MQSTFIKIKFTSLLRHLQKDNTKCCLEIIPDVSCIENLDKIQWNEKNIVEYYVPVTYKIILKKDTDKGQDKVYYSCIDLRHLSTESSLACGDVTRVVSDNYVLNKINIDHEKNIVLSERCKCNKRKRDNSNNQELCVGESIIESVGLTREIKEKCLETSTKDRENQSDNDIDTFCDDRHIDLTMPIKQLKQICIENTVSKETITELTELKTSQNKKLKLTVTSICTLNTIDSASSGIIHEEKVNNNSKMCVKYNHENRVDYKINQMDQLFSINTLLYNEFSIRHNKSSKEESYERILPDMRVAHFMRTVENEILPLKILLSDIYRKCASLGLFWKSNVFQRPKCADKRDFINKNQRNPKCNRVVYSIVFEE